MTTTGVTSRADKDSWTATRGNGPEAPGIPLLLIEAEAVLGSPLPGISIMPVSAAGEVDDEPGNPADRLGVIVNAGLAATAGAAARAAPGPGMTIRPSVFAPESASAASALASSARAAARMAASAALAALL